MFDYKKTDYEVSDSEDEVYYTVMMNHFSSVYSPFEVCPDIDFPNKEKIGGVVLKFIGGGAAYFKVQREMPGKEEIRDVIKVTEFLREKYGEYVVVRIMCEPHIEIRDIDLADFDCDVTYVSSRKNDGDECINALISKLEHGERLTAEEYILSFNLPFMGRRDEEEYRLKYSIFLELFEGYNYLLPSIPEILKTKFYLRVFSEDGSYFIL